MAFAQRLQEIRTGFQPAFWVANITELFERLAYYGVNAVLAVYLTESLKFSATDAGYLLGFFGGVVWFLPILGGTLADRFGFRRSLAGAYLILAVGYFLLGSLSAPWMAPLRDTVPLPVVVLIMLFIPAMGPAIVKPCVVGATARASNENVRSLGYSIYYTLVNIGGTAGPMVAFLVREKLGWGLESVFRVCAAFVFLMFFGILFFFKEPDQAGEKKVASIAEAGRNFVTVVSNGRFMLFLVIFSGFWVVFWQEFIALPIYIRRYVDPNANFDLLLSVDPLVVILFQIAVSQMTRRIPTFAAITLGTLVSAISWLFLVFCDMSWSVKGMPVWGVAALVVLAIGEMIQSPRYYEYISRLAPSGQQGTYMGFAFLPIAIGFVIAGAIGGRLVDYFGETLHRPHQMWLVIAGVGVLTTLLMWVYDRVVKPGQTSASSA